MLQVSATENQFATSAAATSVQNVSIQLWSIGISATQIDASSSSKLTVNINFPVPTQPFELTINWHDGTNTPIQTLTVTPGPTGSVTLPPHFFATNTGATNPAAPIPIDVSAQDHRRERRPDGSRRRDPHDGPGARHGPAGSVDRANDEFRRNHFHRRRAVASRSATRRPDAQVARRGADTSAGGGEATTNEIRQVVLRIVDPAGNELPGKDILVPDKDLNDLPSLLRKLPDGHYRIYLSEGGRDRLVIDVVVRQGRAVDPSDDSGGTQDRPPTSQQEIGRRDPIATDKNVQPTSANDGDASAAMEAARAIFVADPVNAPAIQQVHAALQPGVVAPSGGKHSTSEGAAAGHAAMPLPVSSRSAAASWRRWAAPLLVGGGVVALKAGLTSEQKIDEAMEQLDERSLGKGARLARRLRKKK